MSCEQEEVVRPPFIPRISVVTPPMVQGANVNVPFQSGRDLDPDYRRSVVDENSRREAHLDACMRRGLSGHCWDSRVGWEQVGRYPSGMVRELDPEPRNAVPGGEKPLELSR